MSVWAMAIILGVALVKRVADSYVAMAVDMVKIFSCQ